MSEGRKFSRIDSLGRVVVPVQMRRRLGLEYGVEYTVEETTGGVVIKPVTKTCPSCGQRCA